MTCLATAGWATTSMPAPSARPEVGTTRVVSIPAVVVFPAPLGPSRPKISPSWTSRSRWSTAITSPGYTFVNCSVRITGWATTAPGGPRPGAAVGSGPPGTSPATYHDV